MKVFPGKKLLWLPVLGACLSLSTSCIVEGVEYSKQNIIYNEGYYQLKTVNNGISWKTIFHDHSGMDATPSTGRVPVLVLPIEFSDFPFEEKTLSDIDALIQGESEDTRYWESLGSFYEKSSYGKLLLDFEIAPKTTLSLNSSAFYIQHQLAGDWGAAAMKEAVDAYKAQFGEESTKRFDQDKDGFIDSVIMIYSAPDCSSSSEVAHDRTCWWAYCYYDTAAKGVANSPVGFHYFWASYDFFYAAVEGQEGVDAHTLIHEMGHMLGSDDYYNATGSPGDLEPSGQSVMMAYNTLDHESFTKLSYGWVSPYCVTGDCEITIRPFESTGDCILLADDWNGTAWDEYVMLELYTPTGLNELDATQAYPGRYIGPQKAGIRIWHVDNRLAKMRYSPVTEKLTFSAFIEPKELKYNVYSRGTTIASAFRNGTDDNAPGDYDLISLVSPRNMTFRLGGKAYSELDLWQTGDRFYAKSFQWQFRNGGHLDNGNPLPFSVDFVSVGDEEATIRFTKMG